MIWNIFLASVTLIIDGFDHSVVRMSSVSILIYLASLFFVSLFVCLCYRANIYALPILDVPLSQIMIALEKSEY